MPPATTVYQLRPNPYGIDWKTSRAFSYYTRRQSLSMPSTTRHMLNKDIFAAAGLDPERPPQTWQEVEEYSRKIIESGAAKYGFTTGWPSWVLLENMHAWHGLPFASQGNGFDGLDVELLINGEFGMMHVSKLAEWHEEGIYHYGGRGDSANWIFMNGDCAMMPHSSALIGSMKQSGLNWGATMLPHWGDPIQGNSFDVPLVRRAQRGNTAACQVLGLWPA